MNNKKKIPFSNTLEQNILGAVFDSDLYQTVADQVTEDDFYFETHRIFVRTIKSLVSRGVLIDYTIVIDELKTLGLYEKLGGDERVMQFLSGLYKPTESNLIQYCERLKEYSIERKLLAAAEKIKTMILQKDGSMTTKAMIETAEREVLLVSNNSGVGANELKRQKLKTSYG